MTTVAWDGKTLAADRQLTIGSTPMPYRKLFRAKHRVDGARLLYGCCGDAFDGVQFRRWVEGGDKPVGIKPSFSSVAIDDKGRVWYCGDSLVWLPISLRHWAIGSGCDYAMGAMAAGASAAKAVRIASGLDTNSGVGVDTLRL